MADPYAINLDFIKTPCSACDDATTESMRMIRCEGCQQWFHVRCVRISSNAEQSKKWFCDECQRVKTKTTVNSVPKSADESNRSSVKSDAALTLEQKLKAMEESKRRMEQELEAEMILRRKENEIRRSIENKRIMLERKLNEEEEQKCALLQKEILRQRRKQLDRMKESQRLFVDEEEILDKEFRKLKNFGRTSKTVIESDDVSDAESESEESEYDDDVKSFPSRNRRERGNPVKLSQYGLGHSRSVPTSGKKWVE
ncbi:dnaJ homolog subfamily C member 2-like [Aedes albopictus]|uniref:PHD-type domain-containing protein n=1 Tax=Aedes albopictus TaxID=7160 RepID=A0ABM1ZC70_AEDAL